VTIRKQHIRTVYNVFTPAMSVDVVKTLFPIFTPYCICKCNPKQVSWSYRTCFTGAKMIQPVTRETETHMRIHLYLTGEPLSLHVSRTFWSTTMQFFRAALLYSLLTAMGEARRSHSLKRFSCGNLGKEVQVCAHGTCDNRTCKPYSLWWMTWPRRSGCS